MPPSNGPPAGAGTRRSHAVRQSISAGTRSDPLRGCPAASRTSRPGHPADWRSQPAGSGERLGPASPSGFRAALSSALRGGYAERSPEDLTQVLRPRVSVIAQAATKASVASTKQAVNAARYAPPG